MKCSKCESEWISKTSVVKNCPFCGADLYYETTEDGNKVFDNTAEALAYIYKKHGTEILLSEKLSSYLTDYVPDMSASVKRLMKYFYDVGAAELIKKSINGSEEDKLEAVKKSISRLIENFIDSQMAESITYEFSDALGWKINSSSEISVPVGFANHDPKIQPLPQNEAEVQYHSAFNNKMTYYGSLNVGDTFKFGRFNGKEIEWKVLSKTDSSMYVISTEILCERAARPDLRMISYEDFSRLIGSKDLNVWEKSDIRRWLNGEFYSNAFTENEKEKIGTVESDRVTLLSKEEAKSLMTEQERAVGSEWCLRSPCFGNCVWNVSSDGTLDYITVHDEGGVRPALNLKF